MLRKMKVEWIKNTQQAKKMVFVSQIETTQQIADFTTEKSSFYLL
jgi:hypothetical protein